MSCIRLLFRLEEQKMINVVNKIVILTLVTFLLFSSGGNALKIQNKKEIITAFDKDKPAFVENTLASANGTEDLDPLVDIKITFTVKEIRALDEIDRFSKPDFYVKVYINGVLYKSPVYKNQEYLKPNWSAVYDVDDTLEIIPIRIELWDWNPGLDKLCDLDSNREFYPNSSTINIYYNLKTGHWSGDDYMYPEYVFFDPSGYGRVNGCDDNSIYEKDRDCELWFDITQNDYDGDGIPYWTEVNVFHTDPTVNDAGKDPDCDGIPTEWEFKWGHYRWYDWHNHTVKYGWYYDPFRYENHREKDPDNDGLDNVEEYMTSQWGSDPFRQDVFIEVDQMEAGPDGEPASKIPDGMIDLVKNPFHRRNIILHVDDGCMGGGEMIPFDDFIPGWSQELFQYYYDYFLHGDNNSWRKGIFHYALIVWDANFTGYNFMPGVFQLSKKWVDRKKPLMLLKGEAFIWASVFMHELGHALGLLDPLGHDKQSYYIWQIKWWKYRPYRSCMNYGYTYLLVDYSDGSRGRNDYDDWGHLDLTYFQNEE